MLHIKNLTAGYGKVNVLHGISLDVNERECVALIGANGAGKTTTFKCLTNEVKPTGG
jgi:branched-chain amino acid transport system ATP-binding protein